jgi:tetratricopeptide (TPR) repeat protein
MNMQIAVLLIGFLHLAGSSAFSLVLSFPGDDAFVKMDYISAARQYDSVLQLVSPSPDLLWRLARLHIAMGDVVEGKERDDHYALAVEYARRCTTVDTTNSDGYAWYAAALGSAAMDVGARRKIEVAKEIKRSLERAIQLNSNNDIAWSILGTFYRSLGGISWIERQLAKLLLGRIPDGGYEESEDAFRRAILIAPGIVRHRFELALLYDETDRPAEAAEQYRQCTLLPQQMASDRSRREKSIKWLEEHDFSGASK